MSNWPHLENFDGSDDKTMNCDRNIMLADRHYQPADSVDWHFVQTVVIAQNKNLGDGMLVVSLVEQLIAVNSNLNLVLIAPPAIASIFERYDRLSFRSHPQSSLAFFMALFAIPAKNTVFIDLHPRPMNRILARLRGFSITTGLNLARWPWQWLDTHPVRSPQGVRKRYEEYLDILRRLGMVCTFRIDNTHFYKNNLAAARLSWLPESYIAVHPGSRWMFKSLSPNQWSELVRILRRRYPSRKVVITGGDSEMEVRLGSELSRIPGIVNLVGQTDISNLASILVHADGYIGVDTFASHLASLLMVPGLVIFGPTSSSVWGPDMNSNLIAWSETDKFPCMPCNVDGCGGGKLSMCLASISPEALVRKFDKVVTVHWQ